MSDGPAPRHRPRRLVVAPPPPDRGEASRLLREQPPLPVPHRRVAPTAAGLLARQLLGHRVITRDRG